MNDRFDELAKGMAQSVTQRASTGEIRRGNGCDRVVLDDLAVTNAAY